MQLRVEGLQRGASAAEQNQQRLEDGGLHLRAEAVAEHADERARELHDVPSPRTQGQRRRESRAQKVRQKCIHTITRCEHVGLSQVVAGHIWLGKSGCTTVFSFKAVSITFW